MATPPNSPKSTFIERNFSRKTMNIRKSFGSVLVVFFCSFFAAQKVQAVTPKLPPWDQVQKIVEQQLSYTSDYQPGDLISRRQVNPIFDALATAGWQIKDRSEIANLVCADNDAIIRQFRSFPGGKQFMREVGKSPFGYDRVDSIDRLRGGNTLGESTIELLISTPGGYKNIWNIDTSSKKQISNWMLAPGSGKLDFNAKTGRLYTAKDFLTRLKQSYDAALSGS
jgi:hypothetical protein